eukprot:g1264.t1
MNSFLAFILGCFPLIFPFALGFEEEKHSALSIEKQFLFLQTGTRPGNNAGKVNADSDVDGKELFNDKGTDDGGDTIDEEWEFVDYPGVVVGSSTSQELPNEGDLGQDQTNGHGHDQVDGRDQADGHGHEQADGYDEESFAEDEDEILLREAMTEHFKLGDENENIFQDIPLSSPPHEPQEESPVLVENNQDEYAAVTLADDTLRNMAWHALPDFLKKTPLVEGKQDNLSGTVPTKRRRQLRGAANKNDDGEVSESSSPRFSSSSSSDDEFDNRYKILSSN